MMGRGTEAVMDYWKSEENKVMIRGFDFTVEPDTTYRYRVRIVVFNPNHHRDDVEPGVDTKAEELKGPWSDPSDDVHMPSDVMPYLTGIMPASPTSDVKGHFQVIRFHPADGVTVPHNFDGRPRVKSSASPALRKCPFRMARARRARPSTSTAIKSSWMFTSANMHGEPSPCRRDSSVPQSIGRPLPCCCGRMAPWSLIARPTTSPTMSEKISTTTIAMKSVSPPRSGQAAWDWA